MAELIAKANQAILQAQWLRREGRSLRLEAALLASELGATVIRSQASQKELSIRRMDLDEAISKP